MTFRIHKTRILAFLFLFFLLFLFFCPTQSIKKVDVLNTFAAPSAEHWLGTDHLGRDTFSLLVAGGFRTLLVVFLSTAISFAGGLVLGMAEAVGNSFVSGLIRFAADFSLIMPSFVLALVCSALFGFSPLMIAVVLGIGNMGEYINQVCALTTVLGKREFISAERVVGLPEAQILFFHILPNIAPQMLVFMGNKASSMVIQYSGLTFIGLGAEITNPDWGTLLYQYRSYMVPHPQLVLYPILLICFLTVIFHEMFDPGQQAGISGRNRLFSAHRGKSRGTGRNGKNRRDGSCREMTGKQYPPDDRGDPGSSTKKGVAAEESAEEPLLLKAEDLNLAVGRGDKAVPILHHLNFAIRRGERWGIIGESGAGKSMTINVMAAFLKDGDYTVTGRILYRQGSGFRDLLEMNGREQRMFASKRVSMILQDSINSLNPFEKAGKQWDETIRLHHAGLDKEERENHMLRQMERFSVAGGKKTLQKYPYQLSGGLKQRIAIAMSLESNAGILMADEPTTSLDSISQRKVIDYLAKICESSGLTLLFVSHNLGIVKALCTHVAVMKDGRIVEQGPAEKVLRAPAHPYTEYLLTETAKLGIRKTQSERKGH